MSKAIQTIDLGTKLITYGGKEFEAAVTAYIYHDDEFSLDWDMPEKEHAELVREIDNGSLTPCGIEVRATLDNVSGADSCWGFLISKPEDVMDNIANHGMVSNACGELLTEIGLELQRSYKFIEKYK